MRHDVLKIRVLEIVIFYAPEFIYDCGGKRRSKAPVEEPPHFAQRKGVYLGKQKRTDI